MKKIIFIIAGLTAACILIAGIFSAGLVVGGLILAERNQPEVSQSAPSVNLEPSETDGTLPSEPSIAPTEEETSFLSELNPFKSDESEDKPSSTESDKDELFAPFWEAWEIVDESYVDQPIDEEALMRGAIQGMLDALGDQHTSYMDPHQFQQANAPLEGSYEGIGAWVDPNQDYLTIVSPMPGSPAEEAGLQPDDKVIAIDGEDMTGIDGNVVIRSVLGPAGSKVVLTIYREGVTYPFDVEITRAEIIIPSIEFRMLDDNIGYIHLLQFADDTTDELRGALTDLLAENPDGLILDLRNNGGGYLFTAVEVTSEFIEEGEIVLHEEYGDSSKETYDALKGGLALDTPLVIIVNEGTASASEIVAGALQDHERAPLVGSTTFGKGSVQQWVPLDDDQGAVRVTVARWLTPLMRQIHEIGLDPDYPVTVIYQAAIDAGFDINSLDIDPDQIIILSEEEVLEGSDPQLDKAIEVLKSLFD